MKLPRTFTFAALAGASVLAFGQAGADRLVQLSKTPPPGMLYSTSTGHKPSSDVLHISIGIQPGDATGLKAYGDAVSDPKNSLYRHFLTPEQIGARFGLPQTRIQQIQNYLASQGIAVRLVAKNRLSILADATVGQAESAFHTSIEKFDSPGSLTVKAGSYFSFTTSPAVPATIAGDILNVGGLENFTRPKHKVALTATQLRSVYKTAAMFASGQKGQGRTIGISSFDGFSLANIPLECQKFGLPIPSGGAGTNVTVIPVSGGNGQNLTAGGEADLDIQATLGAAPLSNLLVYDNDVPSNENNDPIGVLTQEVDDNKVDIVTESYGWEFDSGTAVQAHNLHLAMTAQGITYMAASGDSGTDLQGFNYPDNDPEVLSIGGTSVTVDTNGTRTSEVGWNSDGGAGTGGWVPTTDAFNVRPAWQLTAQFLAQPGVPSASAVPYHLFPDISLDADPETGYLIYITGQEMQIGGTSGASPTCAGSWAIVEQQLIADGALTADGNGHFRMGRIQDLIYSFNGSSSTFFDVVSGTNGVLPNKKTSVAGPGWDTDTGWGAPIFSGIVAKISGINTIQSLTVSPTSIVGGNSSSGVVQLSLMAPAAGIVVDLTSSTSDAKVPATVTVAEGSLTATFTITTSSVPASETATITALIGSSSFTANLKLTPFSVSGLTVSPSSVVGGVSSTGTVTISGTAGPAGVAIPISVTGTAAQAPTSVTIPSGSSSVTFSIQTFGVSTAQTVTITAGATGGQKSATLTVNPAVFSGLSISPTTVKSGTAATGTVTLSGAAGSAGMVVTLSSNSSVAVVPKSVTVLAGASSANFTITTAAVTSNKTATITAKNAKLSKTATLTVQADTVQGLTLSSSSVIGGSSSTVTGTVTLTSPAPSAGATVSLSSSNTKGATVPGSVKVVSGSKSATFTLNHLVVTATQTVTIKATLNGTTTTAILTVNPFQVANLTVSPTTVAGGTSSAGVVTLNAIPGKSSGSGVKVLITSSSTAAKVPSSVVVKVGATTGNFTITTTGVATTTTATIKAAVGTSSKTATLTITAPQLLLVSVAPGSVKGSASTKVTGTVKISSPAPPSGLKITLTSSNTLAATVPTTVTIASGKTSATFTVAHKKVTASASATVSAALGSTKVTTSLTVTP